MKPTFHPGLLKTTATLVVVSFALAGYGQKLKTNSAPVSVQSVQQAIKMVESGRCTEALPSLKKNLSRLTDKDLQYHAAMAMARCAMSIGDEQSVVDALVLLKRTSPDDPEALYIATHYFSELSSRAAQELESKAPSSFQARKLQAESLESQGKYDEAISIYRKILEDHPNTPGIHYRLGQIMLSQASPSDSTAPAEAEFEQEIKIDPLNAAAEFVLGELARRGNRWDDAIVHFTKASTLDVGFSEAYLALGMSLTASGQFARSITPLEKYVSMEPGDPAGHYQLALAYARVGNREASARQVVLQRQAASANQQSVDTVEGHAAPQ
jgi:predicted Zn-dependent protease